MAVLGPEREWAAPPAPGPAPAPAPQPKRKGKDPRRLLAEQQANRQAVVDRLMGRVVRSPVVSTVGPGVLPMAALTRLGLSAAPNEQGIPYGIPLRQLAQVTPEEADLLRLSPGDRARLADLYGGGP